MYNSYDRYNTRRRYDSYDYSDDYNRIRDNSIRERRSRRRATVVELSRENYQKLCRKVIPVTLAIGLVVGGLGLNFIEDRIDDFNHETYISANAHEFQSNYIAPNAHRTNDNQGYWYDYVKICDGIKNAENQDEAIFYCYESIGSLQTGRVIKYVGYESFMDYIHSKGFNDLDEYEDFMSNEVVLRNEVNDEKNELDEMLNEHNITNTRNDYRFLGGK